ncbi:MAG: hypothetical protein KF895_08325 [Parvibaculum sp.]|nr:hypothetical protein [Parvibaculum sp.]
MQRIENLTLEPKIRTQSPLREFERTTTVIIKHFLKWVFAGGWWVATQHSQQSLEEEARLRFEAAEETLRSQIAAIKDQLKLQKRMPQILAFEENQADWEKHARSLQLLAIAAPDGGSISKAIRWQVGEKELQHRLESLRMIFYETFDRNVKG